MTLLFSYQVLTDFAQRKISPKICAVPNAGCAEFAFQT